MCLSLKDRRLGYPLKQWQALAASRSHSSIVALNSGFSPLVDRVLRGSMVWSVSCPGPRDFILVAQGLSISERTFLMHVGLPGRRMLRCRLVGRMLLWDAFGIKSFETGGRGGGGRTCGEIRTGQREMMSGDNAPRKASANPVGALELEWPFRIFRNCCVWTLVEKWMILSKVIICRHFSAAALHDGSG